MEVDSGDSEAEKTHEKSHPAGSVSDTGEQIPQQRHGTQLQGSKTIDDLPPTSDDQTLNVSTTHARSEPRLRRCNRKEGVTFDELISTLEESKLLYLEIMFEYEDQDIVVGGSSELAHIQQHRLKFDRCHRQMPELEETGRVWTMAC
ncbi:unnamed protein product [Sphagnum jensenii]|uniref:Uncharacterized protein n=1 Tax=Sphagnum jensenii TaxID=128206 RepID=A0ABP1BJ28_9BRYO